MGLNYGNVCVFEVDDRYYRTVGNNLLVTEPGPAYELFRSEHGDDYDFVVFLLTIEGRNSFGGSYLGIFQGAEGVPTTLSNNRSNYLNSNRLQGIIHLNEGTVNRFQRILCHEIGHKWGIPSRYRESPDGESITFNFRNETRATTHWGDAVDADDSPRRSDFFNWVERDSYFYKERNPDHSSLRFNLFDLYFMGLIPKEKTGRLPVLRNLQEESYLDSSTGETLTRYTADKLFLTIDNLIWEYGDRSPDYTREQRHFNIGFVLLTDDIDRVHDLAVEYNYATQNFVKEFNDATLGLATVDTSLKLGAPGVFRITGGERLTEEREVTISGTKPGGHHISIDGTILDNSFNETSWSVEYPLVSGGNVIRICLLSVLEEVVESAVVFVDRKQYVLDSGDTMTGDLKFKNTDRYKDSIDPRTPFSKDSFPVNREITAGVVFEDNWRIDSPSNSEFLRISTLDSTSDRSRAIVRVEKRNSRTGESARVSIRGEIDAENI